MTLVSIITPTWHRHELLFELIENICHQDHRNIEHVIVSDGSDHNLEIELKAIFPQYMNKDEMNPYGYHIKFVECGRNWSTFLPDSYTAIPLMTATALASANYHMWLADDERMLVPNHISTLLSLLEDNENAGFAYSNVLMQVDPGAKSYEFWGTKSFIIGRSTPEYGQITHCMYKVETLKHGMYRPFVGSSGDWDVIFRWMQEGVQWIYWDELSLSHVAHK